MYKNKSSLVVLLKKNFWTKNMQVDSEQQNFAG